MKGYPAATVRLHENEIAHPLSIMRTVFENGKLLVDDNFSDIRKRALTNQYLTDTMAA
jgi:hypothetical protein